MAINFRIVGKPEVIRASQPKCARQNCLTLEVHSRTRRLWSQRVANVGLREWAFLVGKLERTSARDFSHLGSTMFVD